MSTIPGYQKLNIESVASDKQFSVDLLQAWGCISGFGQESHFGQSLGCYCIDFIIWHKPPLTAGFNVRRLYGLPYAARMTMLV